MRGSSSCRPNEVYLKLPDQEDVILGAERRLARAAGEEGRAARRAWPSASPSARASRPSSGTPRTRTATRSGTPWPCARTARRSGGSSRPVGPGRSTPSTPCRSPTGPTSCG
ncbi:MAG: hypothetical protein M0C28_00590 [Candidatus Moduliflexus flocculans]|nr:hypothetical protein [Candidatus Moduliflexus flocculans]